MIQRPFAPACGKDRPVSISQVPPAAGVVASGCIRNVRWTGLCSTCAEKGYQAIRQCALPTNGIVASTELGIMDSVALGLQHVPHVPIGTQETRET